LIKTKPYKTYDDATQIIYDISGKLIEAGQKKHLEQSKFKKEEKNLSMLGKLIECCGVESPIPHAMALDAIFAGMDTTGNTTAFLLYQLSVNSDAQEQCYQEIVQTVPKGAKLTVPLLAEMKYVRGAMNETLRLLPVVQGIGRKTQKDLVLSGFQIPDGTRVNYYHNYTMRSDRYYNQAEKFMPERWIRGRPEAKKLHPYAFIPFSHGSRMCVGRRVAEMEIQVLMVELLRRFKLEFKGENPIDVKGGLISAPDNPLNIKFVPRV